MTTRQISEAMGKDETTARRWIKKLADKTAASSPGKPADYTLDESVRIIEVGARCPT